MDGLDVGDLGGGDHAGDVQVAVGAGGLTDADGAVGDFEVGGVAVGLRVDGDCLDIEFLARPDDAQGDLAAVGYQHALNLHGLVVHFGSLERRSAVEAQPASASRTRKLKGGREPRVAQAGSIRKRGWPNSTA